MRGPPSSDTQHDPSATTWSITRLPCPSSAGSAPAIWGAGGEVYDHGAWKSDLRKMAPLSRTRSRTRGTSSSGSTGLVDACDSGVAVMAFGVAVMVGGIAVADHRTTAGNGGPSRRERRAIHPRRHGNAEVHGCPRGVRGRHRSTVPGRS